MFLNHLEVHGTVKVTFFLETFLNTVKLSYNELGYNEHSVITNKLFSPNWSFYYIKQPGYNKTRL